MSEQQFPKIMTPSPGCRSCLIKSQHNRIPTAYIFNPILMTIDIYLNMSEVYFESKATEMGSFSGLGTEKSPLQDVPTPKLKGRKGMDELNSKN